MRTRLASRLAVAAALGLVLRPAPAAAHLVGVEFGAFYAGALHVALGLDAIVALLALAFVAAQQTEERARWVLLGLPIGLLIGVGVVWWAPAAKAALDVADPMMALCLAIPGILAAAAARLPAALLAALAIAVGAGIGAVTGSATHGAAIDVTLYAAGVVVAGTMIGTLAVALASRLGGLAFWTRLALRVLGSWITAAGIGFLTLSLFG